ncbi:hypothetical protein NP233_g6832 [Leucocoprinus birnbaumii]|uniref:Uncharacterized protein n=1 Tax=Leucocoprinus birnbaumii TaxID=56174 RepID=A0AAD5VQD7_9AGAR|nr:hypothetical protein NP233_g6832 [Leucocoprinus birnbaumii]
MIPFENAVQLEHVAFEVDEDNERRIGRAISKIPSLKHFEWATTDILEFIARLDAPTLQVVHLTFVPPEEDQVDDADQIDDAYSRFLKFLSGTRHQIQLVHVSYGLDKEGLAELLKVCRTRAIPHVSYQETSSFFSLELCSMILEDISEAKDQDNTCKAPFRVLPCRYPHEGDSMAGWNDESAIQRRVPGFRWYQDTVYYPLRLTGDHGWC